MDSLRLNIKIVAEAKIFSSSVSVRNLCYPGKLLKEYSTGLQRTLPIMIGCVSMAIPRNQENTSNWGNFMWKL